MRQVPTEIAGVPSEVLVPRNTWADGDAYDLAELFARNFEKFEEVDDAICSAGPQVLVGV